MTGQPEKKPRADRFGMPPLANPYDLSTWRAEQPDPAHTGRADPGPADAGRAGPGPAGTGRADPGRAGRDPADPGPAGTGRAERNDHGPSYAPRDARSRRTGSSAGAGSAGRRAPEDDLGSAPIGDGEDRGSVVELFDPVDLPTPDDPFELARRTINRSRAAARDRGLFPISAKTQARDVRDRSRNAPGYSGARPDPRDPQGIQLIMRRVLSDLGWNAGMSSGRVLEEWDEIVGERLAAHCRPVSFDDGVLVVSASSSAWAAQLRLLTPQIVTTIEEHVGSHVVSELKVTGPAAAERSWKKGRRTVTWRGPRDTYG